MRLKNIWLSQARGCSGTFAVGGMEYSGIQVSAVRFANQGATKLG
jgi:hypothetical protein